MGNVLVHASGWQVEPTWGDHDETGPRTWHRVIDPYGAHHWCTTSQLQELLHRHGLDIGDLVFRQQPSNVIEPNDGCE